MKEIVPLIAAAIGLTPVFLKWLNDRSNAAANLRSIQHAKEKIEFWQIWLKAQREVTSDERFAEIKSDVSKRLDELKIKNAVDESHDKDSEELEQGPSFIQRIVLAYLPHTAAGWILHTLFYIIVLFSIFFTFVSSFTTDDINTSNPSWEHLKTQFDYVIPVLLIFLFIAFILARFANGAEKKYFKRRLEAREQKADV